MGEEQKQLLREAEIEPTAEVIAVGLGAANEAYTKFIEEIKRHDIQVDWRYYKDGKSWLGKSVYKWTTSRGTPKEMTACWLSIWEGFFRVSIMLPEKSRAEAMNLPLSEETKQLIANSKQLGKMKIFGMVFDLDSSERFEDIYTLIDFRVKTK